MNCRSAESLYSAFIEDELSQKERRYLEAHLLGCRRCSLAVRELRATIALTQSLPAAEVSEHFEEDVLLRIRSGEALRPSIVEWLAGVASPIRLRPVFAASVGVCAASIAAFVLLSTSPRPAPTTSAVPGTASSAPSTEAPDASKAAPSAATVAERLAPTPVRTAAAPVPDTQRRLRRSDVEVIQSPLALEGSLATGDSARVQGRPLEPQYLDEYILDQFYLERMPVSRDPSMVPASGNPNDDVYITF
jgi:anti-sigma factor RsiW